MQRQSGYIPPVARHLCAIGLAAIGVAATAKHVAATDVKIGGLAILTPSYEGSDRYEVRGAPFAYPVFSSGTEGTFAIYGIDDVRLRLFSHSGFEVGVLGGVAFGRDEGDGPLLAGIGDIDTGGIAGAWLGYRTGGTLLSLSYHEIFGGHSAGYYRASVRHTAQITQQLAIKPRVGITFADDRYMDEYFSISAAQAGSSLAGLPHYNAEAGIKDVHVGLGASFEIGRGWAMLGDVGYKRLIGDAADSPVIETEDQFSVTLGLTYTFPID